MLVNIRLTFVRLFQISYRLDFEMSVFLQKFGYNGHISNFYTTNADSALSNLFAMVIFVSFSMSEYVNLEMSLSLAIS